MLARLYSCESSWVLVLAKPKVGVLHRFGNNNSVSSGNKNSKNQYVLTWCRSHRRYRRHDDEQNMLRICLTLICQLEFYCVLLDNFLNVKYFLNNKDQRIRFMGSSEKIGWAGFLMVEATLSSLMLIQVV